MFYKRRHRQGPNLFGPRHLSSEVCFLIRKLDESSSVNDASFLFYLFSCNFITAKSYNAFFSEPVDDLPLWKAVTSVTIILQITWTNDVKDYMQGRHRFQVLIQQPSWGEQILIWSQNYVHSEFPRLKVVVNQYFWTRNPGSFALGRYRLVKNKYPWKWLTTCLTLDDMFFNAFLCMCNK